MSPAPEGLQARRRQAAAELSRQRVIPVIADGAVGAHGSYLQFSAAEALHRRCCASKRFCQRVAAFEDPCTVKSTFFWIKLGLVCGCVVGINGPVQSATLFGKGSDADAPVSATKRAWYLREFTKIELVAREPGGAANQHPIQLQPEALRQQLLLIRKNEAGKIVPLFDDDEAAELAGPLAQAFANATAADDVQVLTSARRNGSFGTPKGLTARLFVQGDALNLIVHDTDLDFVVAYRQTNNLPHFEYGSRTTAARGVALQSTGASNRRPDWLTLSLRGTEASAAPVPTPVAAPTLLQTTPPAPLPALVGAPPAAPLAATPLAPAAPAAPAMATPRPTPVAAPAAVVPVPARKPGDVPSADEIERRLDTLKRLRDRQLITEDEYQERRKEVLQSI